MRQIWHKVCQRLLKQILRWMWQKEEWMDIAELERLEVRYLFLFCFFDQMTNLSSCKKLGIHLLRKKWSDKHSTTELCLYLSVVLKSVFSLCSVALAISAAGGSTVQGLQIPQQALQVLSWSQAVAWSKANSVTEALRYLPQRRKIYLLKSNCLCYWSQKSEVQKGQKGVDFYVHIKRLWILRTFVAQKHTWMWFSKIVDWY